PERASRGLQLPLLLICLRIIWIYDDRYNRGVWRQLMQQLQSLCFHGDCEQTNSRDVTAWTVERWHSTGFHWVVPCDEHNRDRRSSGLGDCRRGASSDQNDQTYTAIDQLNCLLRKAVILSLRPTVFDCDVATLDVAGLLEALLNCRYKRRVWGWRHAAEDADHGHCLLRLRSERPRCRAAKQRNELAPLHSITSSARASRLSGTVRPSACAVVIFTTRSNLVGCSTGRLPGFAPCRILST